MFVIMGELLPSPKGEVGVLWRPREAGRESGLCGLGYFMYIGFAFLLGQSAS